MNEFLQFCQSIFNPLVIVFTVASALSPRHRDPEVVSAELEDEIVAAEALKWPRPPLFDWLQREGEIDDAEMLRVFNCGIGMVLVLRSDQADEIIDRLTANGERAYRIGETEVRPPEAPSLVLSSD